MCLQIQMIPEPFHNSSKHTDANMKSIVSQLPMDTTSNCSELTAELLVKARSQSSFNTVSLVMQIHGASIKTNLLPSELLRQVTMSGLVTTEETNTASQLIILLQPSLQKSSITTHSLSWVSMMLQLKLTMFSNILDTRRSPILDILKEPPKCLLPWLSTLVTSMINSRFLLPALQSST